MPHYQRVLFVGTGGGNDIFSTTLAMESLWELGWRWNEAVVAGVISPFHRHTVSPTSIPNVFVTRPDSKRYLNRRGPETEIGFIDARVAEMMATERLRSCNSPTVYALSLENGSEGLSAAFRELAQEFDFIVLVDIGGDIFYRGPEDTHVLSPFFDATVLRALVDSKIPGVLFEAGPGTDGELEPEALVDVLGQTKVFVHALNPEVMKYWDNLYHTWIADTRPSRTVCMTINAYKAPVGEIREVYWARGHLGSERRYRNFEHRISVELCKFFYLVDPKIVHNPLATFSHDPFDWFWKTQTVFHTNNEINLEYLMVNGRLLHFLTPSPLLHAVDRQAFLKQGLSELADGISDEVCLLSRDWAANRKEWAGRFSVKQNQDLVHLSC